MHAPAESSICRGKREAKDGAEAATEGIPMSMSLCATLTAIVTA